MKSSVCTNTILEMMRELSKMRKARLALFLYPFTKLLSFYPLYDTPGIHRNVENENF